MPQTSPWGAGTGFGCSWNNQQWDLQSWDAEKNKFFDELKDLADNINRLLGTIQQNTRRIIRSSCFILFCYDHISSSSIAAMNKHMAFYTSFFTMLVTFSKRPELQSLITKNITLVSSKINLYNSFKKLYDQATRAADLSSSALDAEDIGPEIIKSFEQIRQCLVENGSIFIENEQKCDTKVKSYVQCLETERFGTVEQFPSHHFISNASGATNRKLIRRLGGEYADLAVSLPLNEESSVFLRVSESRMDLAQFLVIPADDTPYAGGCFLFDVYFPSTYPNTPPKVNLMTTGGGTVRFNPNLYETGYVCLSLLGTWEGRSQGELWQSNISTFLQVILSVQSLIFVTNPYYNEPGYEARAGDEYSKKEAENYSKDKRLQTVKWAIIDMLKNPPLAFKSVILKHFYLSKDRTMRNVKKWLGDDHQLIQQLSHLLDQLDESVFTQNPNIPTDP